MTDTKRALRIYLTGAVIVWAGTLLATAVLLAGTDQFAQILPILAGSAFWFIVIVPATLFRDR